MTVHVIDSNAAHWKCISEFANSGDVGAALGLAAMTTVGVVASACALWSTEEASEGTVIAPISPGLGQLLGTVTTFASPDAILGHELRHLFDHHFHPAIFSAVEGECHADD